MHGGPVSAAVDVSGGANGAEKRPVGAPRSIVAIAVVDRRGAVLLQLRSRTARVDPAHWTPPGGHVEPGEAPELAVGRELHEETTLQLETAPELYWRATGLGRGRNIEARLYFAPTDAGPADVECREGDDLRFCPPSQIMTLPLAGLYGPALRRFLMSPQYHRLPVT